MTTGSAGWQALQTRAIEQLDQLACQHRLRRLKPHLPEVGSALVAGHIDLTHNDYLGLRVNQKFQERARAATTFLPCGSGASRLLGGEHPIFQQLETAFSYFKQAESSLYFGSGYAANEAVVTTLAMAGAAFFSDELNHASIIDGFKLARAHLSHRSIFPHADVTVLEQQLRASNAEINVIYTESVFSMDGDIAPLKELFELSQRYRGVLVVDEAHAVGLFGKHGSGLIDQLLSKHTQVISINTCGKALACQGALVSGPSWFRDLLINQARTFIYTTGPSPWLAAALLESIALVEQMNCEREHLAKLSLKFREAAIDCGLNVGKSASHIIPIIVGTERHALKLQEDLEQVGVLAKAIRPPTVAEGLCRLRCSLSAALSDEHIEQIITAIRTVS